MTMTTKALAIAVASLLLILVIELVRREKLTFKYAFGWMGVAVFAIICVVFDRILYSVSSVLGFELPSNFVFFSLLTVFVFLCLLMTVFLCQQNNRNDALSQRIGLLEFELKELQKRLSKNTSANHDA